jgi:hypothetical protein
MIGTNITFILTYFYKKKIYIYIYILIFFIFNFFLLAPNIWAEIGLHGSGPRRAPGGIIKLKK